MNNFEPCDCEHFSYIEFDGEWSDSYYCHKAHDSPDSAGVCYECQGKWSVEQIKTYIAKEEHEAFYRSRQYFQKKEQSK